MDIRQSVFGEIAVRDGNKVTGTDLGALIRRLLLFDTVVIRSNRLREIRPLIRAFGRSGFSTLLDSGVLKVSCEVLTLILSISKNGVRTLPACHFSLGIAQLAQREQTLRNELRSLQGIAGLGNAERQALEDRLISSLVRPQPAYGPQFQTQVECDIRSNSPALKAAVEKEIQTLFPSSLRTFDMHVEETEARTFHIITDLSKVYGLTEDKEHDILESCVRSVANLNQRIADMEAYSSITGFADDEASLLFGKFAGIIRAQNPEPVEKQFARVVSLAGLPDFVPDRRVDVEKLLKARESLECVEFRSWITKLGSVSDSEIQEMLEGVKSKLGTVLHGGVGKTVRLATTTAIGAIPGAGLVAGPIAGALDAFLIDKIFPTSGVVAFLTQTYPSLFDKL
jgi:hypothetical protein